MVGVKPMHQVTTFLKLVFLVWSVYFLGVWLVTMTPLTASVRVWVGIRASMPLKLLHGFVLKEMGPAAVTWVGSKGRAWDALRQIFMHSFRVVPRRHLKTLFIVHLGTLVVPALAGGFWSSTVGVALVQRLGNVAVYLPFTDVVGKDLSDMPALEVDLDDDGGAAYYERRQQRASVSAPVPAPWHGGVSILDRLPSPDTSDSASSQSSWSPTRSTILPLSPTDSGGVGAATTFGSISSCSLGSADGSRGSEPGSPPGYGSHTPLPDDWLVYDEVFGLVPMEVLTRWRETEEGRQGQGRGVEASQTGDQAEKVRVLPPVRFTAPFSSPPSPS